MFAVIRIPDFALSVQLRHLPDLRTRPTAVLDTSLDLPLRERNRCQILTCNALAASSQVTPGMPAVQAQARCPGLELLTRDPDREAAAQKELLQHASRFSPDLEETSAGMVTLDTFASPVPSAQLGANMLETFLPSQLPVRIGFASNPDLAALVSQVTDSVRILSPAPETVTRFLAPLPLDTLSPSRELGEILRLWGVQTLGDLTRLSRQEITSRLGAGGASLWDQARGQNRRLLQLVRPPQDYRLALDLDHDIETLDPLLFVLKRFLDTLCTRLASAYLCAGTLQLLFAYRHSSAYRKTFRVPTPSRDAELLFRMLQTHLESFQAPEPIVSIRLQIVPDQESRQQFQLFESSLRDPNRFAETLAQVEALLGAERTGNPSLRSSHRPDAFALSPYEEPASPDSTTSWNLGLPLRRFRPSFPITVQTETSILGEMPSEITSGIVRGKIHSFQGPWLTSSDWWDETFWSHREWDVRLPGGECLRLRQSGSRWFLDGRYA